MTSYIYLIETDSDIFKIGRTTQNGGTRIIKRLKSYPSHSILKSIKEVPSSLVIEIESKILQTFKSKYQLKKGREWFQGNCLQMINDIDCIINQYNDSIANTNSIITNQINNLSAKPIYNDKYIHILSIIRNYDITNIAKVRYWLIDNCQKWILYHTDTNIFAFYITKNDKRMDNATRAFKEYILKGRDDIKNDKNFFKSKKIENDNDLVSNLKKYIFISGDDKINNVVLKDIELYGYTKKYILSVLSTNNIDKQNPKIICQYCSNNYVTAYNCKRHEQNCKRKDIIKMKYDKKSHILYRKASCSICNKTFSNIYNKNTHEVKCKLKIKNDSVLMKIENFTNRLDALNTNFNKMIKNLENKTDVISNSIHKIKNSSNGNTGKYMSKKDKLNLIKDMIDIDTFINNYKNNTKYHLSKDEAKILIENSEKMGIEGYGSVLYKFIKQKYSLLLEDTFEKKQNPVNQILPFFLTDCNIRRHYERRSEGWILTDSKEKISSIVNISDNQIFNHHQRFADYSMKTGKSRIVNVILRNACYENIEPELKRLSKITHLEIEPVEN
jgi:hypothetical protein